MADMARHVAAIVWEGQSQVDVHSVVGGFVGFTPAVGIGGHSGRVRSDLAAALCLPDHPPSRRRYYGWIFACLVTVACLSGLATSSEAPTPWLGFAAVVSPFVAVIVWLVVLLLRHGRQDRRWRRAMPEMGAVWGSARYCGRCALAFFPREQIPASLPDRVDPLGFRGLVWQAGIMRHELAASRSPVQR